MTPLSIRARLTVWYVTVLAVATLTLTGAGWWFSTQSVIRAVDVSLQARVDGVRQFLENPRTRLTVEGLQDEFGEYAELTRGEALLEVLDPSGAVLVQPSIPGWTDTASADVRPTAASAVVASDRTLGRLPFRVASAAVDAAGGRYRVTVAAPMGPSYDALNRFHRRLLLLLPVVLALAALGGYWISGRALAPVDHITRFVQAITVQRLDQRVELPPADDEIRRLASTFNAVLAQLQVAVGDIVRFTADASHELRTPVALVRTTAELALRRERRPDEYRTALSEVLDHTARMSTLVDDLLVLARADAGIEPPRDSAFDALAVTRAACHGAAVLAKTRGVDLTLDGPDEPFVANGDGPSLQRLLLILLDNAVKYSSLRGKVSVEVTRDGRDDGSVLTIAVTDDGIGVDAAETPRLFERFYRGKLARRHAPDGNGLGLAIARTIADRYGWALRVEPDTEGGVARGCRAEVRLASCHGAARGKVSHAAARVASPGTRPGRRSESCPR